MSTDMAVIEAALKAATRGPWMAIGDRDDYLFRGDVATAGDPGERMVICEHAGIDANLIANAPAWLAELVERVKVAEAEVAALREREITGETAGEAMMGAELRRHAARRQAAEAAIERVRAAVADHPGSAWDSGIKLRADILRALDGDAKRCTSDITLRDEEHRLCRCTLTEGHAGDHDDGAGTTWTGGDA